MEYAGADRLRNSGQAQRLRFALVDVRARFLHQRRFGVLFFDHDLINQSGELLPKKKKLSSRTMA